MRSSVTLLILCFVGVLNQSYTAREISSALSGKSENPVIALWLFDEPQGLYPSCILNDHSQNDYAMVLGLGGRIVPGKFGNALEPSPYPELDCLTFPEGEVRFGLKALPPGPGRKVPPLSWHTAQFCAFIPGGENHLRKEATYPHPTRTQLNLGNFDWTVEFWFRPVEKPDSDGVVFEIGTGPRGENRQMTRLAVKATLDGFEWFNHPTNTRVILQTDASALNPSPGEWHHLAFVYNSRKKTLRHFLDGKLVDEKSGVQFESLPEGDEDYFTVGRDGLWRHPLPGRLDELRFSAAALYEEDFPVPGSFSPYVNGKQQNPPLKKGPPLLFIEEKRNQVPIPLGNRKYLFIDDAIVETQKHITYVVNPPRKAERVIDNITGPFRKHLTVVEDEQGYIRMYNSVEDDYLQVLISRDGIHFQAPDLGTTYFGRRNITIPAPVGGLGTPFRDPNGPPEERWKYISDFHRQGIYLFVSPDGLHWKRLKPYLLPFRSGTQSCAFYDDQQQKYLAYHRSDVLQFPGGETRRETAFTVSRNIYPPWSFKPLTLQDVENLAKKYPLREPQPWFLDNGPLAPPGFSFEYPHLFTPVDTLDPSETDIYVTKAIKYPWAPDVYLAFPIVYFHYEVDSPVTRRVLMDSLRGRGSGPIETQLAVSRDGFHWKRYPRPAYVGIGPHAGRDVKTAYIAQGMVRRGNEIWQYYFGETQYHSAWKRDPQGRGVYRLVQRLDGFVSADAPYDKEAILITKPLLFKGNRLVLNIDTDATGYAQVGFLDEKGNPIPGYSVEECIYINGDFIATEVEWLKKGTDVSALVGKPVRLMFRMRGAKLYAMQFVSSQR